MRRRTFLATFVAGATAGCLDGLFDGAGGEDATPESSGSTGGSNDTANASGVSPTRRYERCDRVAVAYESLPADVRAEFDAALRNGPYVTDGPLLLVQALDPSVSYVERDGTYYRPVVRQESGKAILRVVVEERPTLPTGRTLTVNNGREEPITVSLLEDGRVVAGPTAVEPGAITSFQESAIGTYTLRVRGEDGFEGTFRWHVGERWGDPNVFVTGGGLEADVAVADLPRCPWTA
ncbi:hypothetical protein [Halomarina pelagica]|uniref:hypothetical protein n=1 Tax=Halomarina pelagica TaxID=2961599 RepID=UPI0020C3614A|nr:hypothetical protein [Halomarina sp. BND7]